MNETSRAWVNAAITLSIDPAASVRCPACGDADLDVMDVRVPKFPDALDRYLHCPRCHAYEVISGTRPEAESSGRHDALRQPVRERHAGSGILADATRDAVTFVRRCGPTTGPTRTCRSCEAARSGWTKPGASS